MGNFLLQKNVCLQSLADYLFYIGDNLGYVYADDLLDQIEIH